MSHKEKQTREVFKLFKKLKVLRDLEINNIPSCLSFCPSSALRLSLHSLAMRLQSRLEYEQKSCAILGIFFFSKSLTMIKLNAREVYPKLTT